MKNTFTVLFKTSAGTRLVTFPSKNINGKGYEVYSKSGMLGIPKYDHYEVNICCTNEGNTQTLLNITLILSDKKSIHASEEEVSKILEELYKYKIDDSVTECVISTI